jgi:hypothetical protein
VAITDRFLSAQGGGTKAIRFDMGTGVVGIGSISKRPATTKARSRHRGGRKSTPG